MTTVGPQAEFTTRHLEEADAGALARCFKRCYGESYGHREFYDPEATAARLRDGSLRSVIAVTGAGEVVGHTGLSLIDPGAAVIEAGNTVVDPAHRGTGVLKELGIALVDRCRTEGLSGFMHYPTTAHEIMQKTAVRFGGVETGVMLAYVPADTEYVDVDIDGDHGRLAATVVFQPLGPLEPRGVAYPERHETLLKRLYAEMGAERQAREPGTPNGETSLAAETNKRQALTRVSVRELGADLVQRVQDAAPEGTADTTLIDLPLESGAVGAAVEALADLGFFYCALLPAFAPGDTLRLQRVERQPEKAFAPALANATAAELVAYMNADRARVG